MTPAQERKILKGLSKHAQNVYANLRKGHWYDEHKKPKCMTELIKAGLVKEGARVKEIAAAYVPYDVVGYKLESWRGYSH